MLGRHALAGGHTWYLWLSSTRGRSRVPPVHIGFGILLLHSWHACACVSLLRATWLYPEKRERHPSFAMIEFFVQTKKLESDPRWIGGDGGAWLSLVRHHVLRGAKALLSASWLHGHFGGLLHLDAGGLRRVPRHGIMPRGEGVIPDNRLCRPSVRRGHKAAIGVSTHFIDPCPCPLVVE